MQWLHAMATCNGCMQRLHAINAAFMSALITDNIITTAALKVGNIVTVRTTVSRGLQAAAHLLYPAGTASILYAKTMFLPAAAPETAA